MSTLRPSTKLVHLAAIAVLLALAATAFPLLVVPTLGYLGVVIVLSALDAVASRRDPEPQLERDLPERMTNGRPSIVSYRLSCPGGPQTAVSILDELPDDLGGDLIIENTALGRNQRVELVREVLPKRRGVRQLGPTFVAWRSRLGLLCIRKKAIDGAIVTILPRLSAPERRGPLTHRSLFEELGLRPKAVRGDGSEFESMREYVRGDDPRHIDWRASARRGRLVLRQYHTERRHTVIVAVDTGRLMAARSGADSKLDRAVECSIALARISDEFGDRVGFLGFDRELRAIARPRLGARGVTTIVEATLALVPHPFEPDYRVLVEALARYQNKRALIVVLTDFVEGSASRELQAWLQVLARRHCVMLVAMRDRILGEVDRREPVTTASRVYRRLALQDVVIEREAALLQIRRSGIHTLDLDPEQITAPVLSRYLAIRRAGLL